MIEQIIGGIAAVQVLALSVENQQRQDIYKTARQYADITGKPLLVIGKPNRSYPCGDITGDINPEVILQCPTGGSIIDVRDIPYPSGYFGSTFISHVLEHLPTIEDAQKAWYELWRVSDMVFVAYPRRYNPYAIINPNHHLWVSQDLNQPRILYVTTRSILA